MTIITRAAEFCSSPKFERVFDNFARDHADAFIDATEAKDGDVEHKHEEIRDGQFTALFEEHTYAWFVDHLLACMDYKHFYGLMVNEARRLHHRK
ncbi:hypothetical protein AM588_10008567 [Phytophthora nicotianae]|uniref:BART domain-containing protein n=1 Tax=Phytophthora nicotianae TaxID=4792 RepID=A0A0W8D924_PHYNI|nr:hypothetical protein AM588_10008567 [Phytophthora nicotianae]